MMIIGLGGGGVGVVVVVEGIVLGGGRKAAAHRYGAHIWIESCGCDGR